MGELGEMSMFTKISVSVRKIWPCMEKRTALSGHWRLPHTSNIKTITHNHWCTKVCVMSPQRQSENVNEVMMS